MHEITHYEIVILITDIISTFNIYIFMNIFFSKLKYSKNTVYLSFTLYYIVMIILEFYFNIPFVMMAANLISFFLLTFNYKSNIKKRIISAICIYVVLMLTESFVVIITGYINKIFYINTNYHSIGGLISIQVLSFIVIMLIKNLKYIKSDTMIPPTQLFSIFIIPTGSLGLILIILQDDYISKNFLITILLIVFAINICTFKMYNLLNLFNINKVEQILLTQQNKYFDQQFEIMKASLERTKSVTHDFKNHLSVIYSYLKINDLTNSLKYLDEICCYYSINNEFAKSGNITIDSILNYKINVAHHHNINVNLTLRVPDDLYISPFNINIILSNLLDNAINATLALDTNRKIELSIIFIRGILKIQISNNYTGKIEEKKGKIITCNKDKEFHGIGLNNIKQTVDSYHGDMKIHYTQTIFMVDIIMYVMNDV